MKKTKAQARQNAKKKWLKNKEDSITKKEVFIYLAGFNAGWKDCKKEIMESLKLI